jgi:hypothetical protein
MDRTYSRCEGTDKRKQNFVFGKTASEENIWETFICINLCCFQYIYIYIQYMYIYNLWPESASELYRPSGSRLSAKLVPTFADTGCHVVSMTNLLRP